MDEPAQTCKLCGNPLPPKKGRATRLCVFCGDRCRNLAYEESLEERYDRETVEPPQPVPGSILDQKEKARDERELLREQRKAEQELAAERERLEKEKAHYETALEQLRAKGDNAAAEELAGRLAQIEEAIEANDYRTANIRAGYVYVISNIGALGRNIVKIGMTRRLEPRDRVSGTWGCVRTVPVRHPRIVLLRRRRHPRKRTTQSIRAPGG